MIVERYFRAFFGASTTSYIFGMMNVFVVCSVCSFVVLFRNIFVFFVDVFVNVCCLFVYVVVVNVVYCEFFVGMMLMILYVSLCLS